MVETDKLSDEKYILARPWALKLMKTIKEMSKDAVLRWCTKVIEIGEADIDVDSWTGIFSHQVGKTFEELIEDLHNLHAKMLDKIRELLEHLEKLCKDLHVPIPLVNESKSLYEQQRELQQLIEEYEIKVNIRRKELSELRDEQLILCKILEAEPMLLSETPLPTQAQINIFKKYLEKLKCDKSYREEKYNRLKAEITKLVQDLNIEVTLEFEKVILSADSEIDITQTNMKQLEIYHQNLIKQAKCIRDEITQLRTKIHSLWEMLEVDASEQEPFQPECFLNSQDELKALKIEFKRLEEQKKASIKMFIDKRREELKELWEKCYCDETQKNEFHFFDSDQYSEDLLEILDREVAKWHNYYEDCREIIMKLEKHLSLWNELLELERNAECTDRYKNRGGKLLVEEKARNKLSKKIPELEQNLIEFAELFEVKNRHPFRTYGKTVIEYLHELHEKWEEEKKKRLISKKQQRENIGGTPAKSATACPSSSTANLKTTPASVRHNPHTLSGQKKQKKVLREANCDNKSNIKHPGVMPAIKYVVLSPARRMSAERKKRMEKGRCARRLPLKVSHREDISENASDINPSDCDTLERDFSDKENCDDNNFVLSGNNSTFNSHDKYKTNERKPACLQDAATAKTSNENQIT